MKYEMPQNWISYDTRMIVTELVEAKSALKALMMMPYQRSWVEKLQQMQLKREVAGTSQIEGADFTENELDEAMKESPEQLITRSQKQAHAASNTYRWIATLPDDQPITSKLIQDIHRKIVTGADDDHCPPGKLRTTDQNVTYGQPRQRGADGGKECNAAINGLSKAIQREYQGHDPIIQALAAHYHFAAIHPFLDGNGRTARALEALLLQRAGLRDSCFIALSNYYYDEKISYLNALNEARNNGHDLTAFLKFALNGINQQVKRLMTEIKVNIQKAVFRNTMYDMYGRLETKRKKVLADRQLSILKLLLENDEMNVMDINKRLELSYSTLKNSLSAFVRDINGLIYLRSVNLDRENFTVSLNLDWPKEITEVEFLKNLKELPKAKSLKFL